VGSYESTGIDVLIVGTGLAGLVAALECVRKGHNVKVLERNETINTAGEPSFSTCCHRVLTCYSQAICISWVSVPHDL
jgi:2-polyprenyl-6-methoxyphenol hydroxylase-like FAD-dependent oxidoreductase